MHKDMNILQRDQNINQINALKEYNGNYNNGNLINYNSLDINNNLNNLNYN